MLTQVPARRQIEDQPQLPSLCNSKSMSSVEGFMSPFMFPDPMCDLEFEAMTLAQCFSLARARARELRQSKPPIADLCADSKSAGAVASDHLEPERGECIGP